MSGRDGKPIMASGAQGEMLAALENLDPAFEELLGRLGLDVVLVSLRGDAGSPIWNEDISERLSEELRAANCGNLDSSTFAYGRMHLFFHCSDLSGALQVIKGALERRRLFTETDAWIFVGEPETK